MCMVNDLLKQHNKPELFEHFVFANNSKHIQNNIKYIQYNRLIIYYDTIIECLFWLFTIS